MLDPHFKAGVFKNVKLPRSVAVSTEKYLQQVFHRYRQALNGEGSPKRKKRAQPNKRSEYREKKKCQSFYNESQMCRGEDDDVAKIRTYLAQDRAQFDYKARDYWQAHKTIFFSIYRMAKDYLSMIAMSAPSESLFSRMKCIVTDKRNRLLPETIKMLAILKSRGIVTEEVSTLLDSLKNLKLKKAKYPKESTPHETNSAQKSEGQEEAEPPSTTNGRNSGCVNELDSIDSSKDKSHQMRVYLTHLILSLCNI